SSHFERAAVIGTVLLPPHSVDHALAVVAAVVDERQARDVAGLIVLVEANLALPRVASPVCEGSVPIAPPADDLMILECQFEIPLNVADLSLLPHAHPSA